MNKDNYVTDKVSVLNNPGTKLNNVYYNKLNSSVMAAELAYNTGRTNISLNSTAFNSSAQIFIPAGGIIDNAILHLRVPDLAAGQTLCRGWGYAALRNISYLLGSTNTSQYELDGISVWDVVSRQANTAEKRSRLFKLGGEEKLLPDGNPSDAFVVLPIPQFGELCKGQKPIDSRLLSDQITLTFNFRDASVIFGGTQPFPSNFLSARCYLRQAEFTNLADSISTKLRMDRELVYNQPFIHHQSFPLSPSSDANGQVQVVLQSFLDADLLGITVSLIRRSELNSGANSPRPFNYVEMLDCRINYNGQDIYNTPGRMSDVVALLYQDGGHYFENSVINAGGTDSSPVDSKSIWVDISRFNGTCYSAERGYSNTPRYGNNTMLMSFNTGEANQDYVLVATYHYNGVVIFNDMHSYTNF